MAKQPSQTLLRTWLLTLGAVLQPLSFTRHIICWRRSQVVSALALTEIILLGTSCLLKQVAIANPVADGSAVSGVTVPHNSEHQGNEHQNSNHQGSNHQNSDRPDDTSNQALPAVGAESDNADETEVQPQVLTIPEGTTGLSPIEGQVVAVDHVRFAVSDAVTGVETRIELEFTLQGCLDSLMPLVSHHEVQDNSVTVYVAALNVHNQASTITRCVAAPKATAQLRVPGIFQQDQIRVVFLSNK